MGAILDFISTKFPQLSGSWMFLIFIVVLSCFEFSKKIPVNPITSILSWIGERINSSQNDKIELLSGKVDELSYEFKGHIVESQRSEILAFANQEMRGQKHTKEEFDRIIKIHDDYKIYIKTNNMENGQVDAAYKYIKDIYYEYLRENNFL